MDLSELEYELPPELIEEVRPRIRLSQRSGAADRFADTAQDERPRSRAGGAFASGGFPGAGGGFGGGSLGEVIDGGMRLGTRVRHGKFGEGVVLTIEGQGPHARVQVNFERQGSKWLMLQYANLQVV